MGEPRTRTADPWRDTDVLDVRAARFAQGFTGVVAILGVAFGWPLAWALMSAQLLVGLTLGRRFCIPCLVYFALIQPRVGEGELEDSRPPRLANAMGFVFLGLAAVAWWLGAPAVGYALGGMVAFLAILSASTGFCAGCEIYRLVARLRGIKPAHHDRVDPADFPGLGDGAGFLEFTHPLCSECSEWERRLTGSGEAFVAVDVRREPQLARKYGVTVVPTVYKVAADGEVLERLAP